MEDTKQGEGNETPQTPAPKLVELGTDNHSVEPTPPVENQEPEVKPEVHAPTLEPEPAPEVPEPTISEGSGNDVVAEPESLSETIQVDKRAIEFLERNLGYEAMKHFKENFLK